MELVDIRNGQSVLEVIMGTGLVFYEIAQVNPKGTNVGIDICPGMLQKAKKRLRKLRDANYVLEVGDALSIDEPPAQIRQIIEFQESYSAP